MYKPRNATEGFMLWEIEYLKKEIERQKEKIEMLEEDNDRLNKLSDWYRNYIWTIKEDYKNTHSLRQAVCIEADCKWMKYQEENEKLKEKIKKLETDLKNLECEFWFECEECKY